MKLKILERSRRGTAFFEQGAKTIVNPPEATGMGFWSLNPYIGCEFGCTYCYARFAHRYVLERARQRRDFEPEELGDLSGIDDPAAFETRIFVKQRGAVLSALDRDLRRIRKRNEHARQTIAIGTATDPYQPAERRFAITRTVLERLTRERGLRIGIVTKSPLVCRDAGALKALGRRHALSIHISLITTDERLIRVFETRSPMPHARLRALGKLASAGLPVGLIAAPVLPGITDSRSELRRLFYAARGAGAGFVYAGTLRIYPGVRPLFLPLLDKHFPELGARYRTAYREATEAPNAYRDALRKRVSAVADEAGLPMDTTLDEPEEPPAQLSLWSLPRCDDRRRWGRRG